MIAEVQLEGTRLRTTVLGLGCANLFRMPSATARRAILDRAFDGGIRHFDTAPMYGMGRSEVELGRFARGRRDQVVIATKFGIRPTACARVAGRVQGPVRRVLAGRPALQEQARTRAANPSSGRLGSLLYERIGYSGTAARSSLERSLRALGTDHVDLLLLHDPEPGSARTDDVCAALAAAETAGQVRTWGIAGEPAAVAAVAGSLPVRPPVRQVRDDVLARAAGSVFDHPAVVFGVLQALGPIADHLAGRPGAIAGGHDEVGVDFGDLGVLADAVLAEALDSNEGGVVLYSSTRPHRIDRAAAVAAARPDPAVVEAVRQVASAIAQQRAEA